MGCPFDASENIKIEKNVMPSVKGVNVPKIVRVTTRYGWEQVRLPRSTYVIGYYSNWTVKSFEQRQIIIANIFGFYNENSRLCVLYLLHTKKGIIADNIIDKIKIHYNIYILTFNYKYYQ